VSVPNRLSARTRCYRDEKDEEQPFWTTTPSFTFDEEYYSQYARNQTPPALVEKFEKHFRIQPKKKKKKFRAFKWFIVDGGASVHVLMHLQCLVSS